MRRLARWLLVTGAGALALAGGVASFPQAASRAGVVQPGPVSPTPAAGTPALVRSGTQIQVIRQIVQCGGTMYAVGSFTQISQNGTTYTRDNIFSFSATAPYTVSSWTAATNGIVDSIALTSNCGHAYIGGNFTQVDGSAANNIAYIRTYNNTMVQSWAHSANGEVQTLLLTPNGHLLAGGRFTAINGSKRAYYVSLNPSTGTDDGYVAFTVSGNYVYPGVAANHTNVFNQQLSPLGSQVLVEGVFSTVESNPRQQIFMLNLGSSHANVSNWNSADFSQHCADLHPFYITDAAWSPDASTIYLADTGFAPYNWNGTFPLTGLCDAAVAFPATRVGGLTPEWINYTGCDSLYSAASDGSAVYVAGHPRWSENPNGCNDAGPGAITDPGLQGLSPADGSTMVDSSGNAVYSMSRANADDMVVTSAGLWIASTDRYGSSWCGGAGGHAGICFLPYSP